MITIYKTELILDAEEKDIIESALESCIRDAESSETLCDDHEYLDTLRAFLKILEEMREV